jgi:Zn-dependent peptidase ImmA (M78 family)/transcriptional regulator with XRE-family HTH domain
MEQTFRHKLKEAREARAMSLDDLSKKTELSKQVISKYENGKLMPRVETLSKLAEALNVQLSYFATEPTAAQLTPLFFRHFVSKTGVKQRTAAERQMAWVQRLVAELDKYVELPPVNIPDFHPPSDPLKITNAEIEKAAVALRRHWGLQDGVIPNLVKLVENNGCVVASSLVDCASMDGFSQWEHEGRPFVAIGCREVTPAHQRTDVAHELGHLVLHRAVDKRYVEQNPETHKKIEAQAFRFAGAFMLPEPTFRQSLPYVSLDTLLMLKPQWRLSVAAMLRRSQDLGMVSEDTAKRLWINLNRRGWKQGEPLENTIAMERPQMLAKAVAALKAADPDALSSVLRDVGISVSDVARYVGLPEADVSVEHIPDFAVAVRHGGDIRAIR